VLSACVGGRPGRVRRRGESRRLGSVRGRTGWGPPARTRKNHGPFSTVKISRIQDLWAERTVASPGSAAYVWYVIVTAVFEPDGLRFLATIVPAAPLKAPVPPVTVP
jgi:hypothetical protein